MVFVICNIAFSSAFNLLMKYAHARRYGILAVGCVNYIVAGLVACLWFLSRRPDHVAVMATLFGCLGGLMYVLCYLCIMAMLDRQGISVATALTRLAIVVPIMAAVLFWHERPNGFQVSGLLLAGIAILLFDFRRFKTESAGFWQLVWPLAGCFFTAGGARLCQKAFGEYCRASERPAYIAAWFAFAGLVSLATLLIRRLRPTGRDVGLGTVLGLVNIATLFFILAALRNVATIIVFPATAVGSLVLVVTLASLVWHERMQPRTRWGIVLACAALVLVNLT